jgi:hypothetical protein
VLDCHVRFHAGRAREVFIGNSGLPGSELREALSRFTKAARKTGGRARTARPGSASAREVRLWAAGQGLQVNTRGRIQTDIMEKYEARKLPLLNCPGMMVVIRQLIIPVSDLATTVGPHRGF